MSFSVQNKVFHFTLFVSVFLFGYLFTSEVAAHQIKSDGSISILQHSDPNDDPVAGTTTTLYLNFTDSENKFRASDCACVVYIAPYAELDSITETGDIFTFEGGDLIHSYNENYSLPYVFPNRDIYAIVVEGAPRDAVSFEPFRIVFDLRVAQAVDTREEFSQSLPVTDAEIEKIQYLNILITTGLLFLVLAVGILVQKRFRIKK